MDSRMDRRNCFALRGPGALFVCALFAILTLVGVASGCHAAQQRTAIDDSPGQWMIRTEMIFGLGRRGGADVSDAQWRDFVDHEITPRFPDGLSILNARGQWRYFVDHEITPRFPDALSFHTARGRGRGGNDLVPKDPPPFVIILPPP